MVETVKTPLWDFGWFDLTRFKVDGPPSERKECGRVLEEFLRQPISHRSFCDPGPWGDRVGRHGPFFSEKLVAEWFLPISIEEFKERIQAVLYDHDFTEPPSADQRKPVWEWEASIRARGDDLFALEAPDEPGIKVDWEWIWTVYWEIASISPDRAELSFGVIGYD